MSDIIGRRSQIICLTFWVQSMLADLAGEGWVENGAPNELRSPEPDSTGKRLYVRVTYSGGTARISLFHRSGDLHGRRVDLYWVDLQHADDPRLGQIREQLWWYKMEPGQIQDVQKASW